MEAADVPGSGRFYLCYYYCYYSHHLNLSRVLAPFRRRRRLPMMEERRTNYVESHGAFANSLQFSSKNKQPPQHSHYLHILISRAGVLHFQAEESGGNGRRMEAPDWSITRTRRAGIANTLHIPHHRSPHHLFLARAQEDVSRRRNCKDRSAHAHGAWEGTFRGKWTFDLLSRD